MIITLIIIAAVALVALGIFIAANNPALAQWFKTEGRKALDAAKAEGIEDAAKLKAWVAEWKARRKTG